MSDSEKPEEGSEPKIVVDTDWKEQVAKEKEAAQQTAPAEQTETDADTDADVKSDSTGNEDGPAPPPPATFDVLISMLFTQAMSLLGQMPDPSTGETSVNKPYAKHYIDTLDMLGEKTQGNLTDDEKKMLSEALHALRMMYVNTKAS